MRYFSIILLFSFPTIFSCGQNGNELLIKYYGHSCFEFNYTGQRILIDPFTPEWFDYELPEGYISYGFASHQARDHSHFEGLDIEKIYYASGGTDEFEFQHNNIIKRLKGKITEYFGGRKFTFWTVPSFHDDVKGARNGVNGIICFDFNGVKIVHLGDIGHVLEDKQISSIGEVDILMVPVDSYYIIELEAARKIVDQLYPKIVIPIHFKTEKSKNKAYMDDLDKFIKMFTNIKKSNSCVITIDAKDLNVDPYLLILEYAKRE